MRRRGAWLLAAAVLTFVPLTASALASSTRFVEPRWSPVPVGFFPQALAEADFNGDGRQDLAVADTHDNPTSASTVTILINRTGRGLVESKHSPYAVGGTRSPLAIAAGDLDGDGDPDLVEANTEDVNDLRVLRNLGGGRFRLGPARKLHGGPSGPAGMALADLDGDGDRDLALADKFHDRVTIFLNNGSGHLSRSPHGPVPTGHGPDGVVAADLDHDGDADLAVANCCIAANGDTGVTILVNNGAGEFHERASSPEPVRGTGPFALAAADLDSDGSQDLAVLNFSDDVSILRNNGAGNFRERASSPTPGGDNWFALSAADFDGDADMDLAVTLTSVTMLRNNGSGRFVEPPSSPFSLRGSGAESIATGDLNGDGDPDIAVGARDSNTVNVLLNRSLTAVAPSRSSHK